MASKIWFSRLIDPIMLSQATKPINDEGRNHGTYTHTRR